ncbi:glycosyltransferase [Leptolyngbya sp. KIOST-1]|uniref:glycosyltransferase n=1 Tax=Leptolyngbya sp. KIOST-1 TaxID=1229172 RepID=UPI0005654264|nr:glycosyltransferase [Leptolyngbya sp. KIOST-1]
MKILFLDQSGKLGGAELSLLDVASAFSPNCLVGIFQDGPFAEALAARQIPYQVLTQAPIQVNKDSGWADSLSSIGQVVPLVATIARLGRKYDLIYTNTSKALILGALASRLCGKPLVHHLRDIVSPEHFSAANRTLLITAANGCATHVIANSRATAAAFVAAGGNAKKVSVVYNGFLPQAYQTATESTLREDLGLGNRFVVGHFSRLAPWKGQHILIEALAHCPESVVALLVGDALFGEQDYVETLHRQVEQLGLNHRVKFLGFRSDIAQLMQACDLVVHTSTAPEPFGRVIVEAMLCQRPVIAAASGGTVELITHGETGWLCPPGQPQKLSDLICHSHRQPAQTQGIAQAGYHHALAHFTLETTQQALHQQLAQVVA